MADQGQNRPVQINFYKSPNAEVPDAPGFRYAFDPTWANDAPGTDPKYKTSKTLLQFIGKLQTRAARDKPDATWVAIFEGENGDIVKVFSSDVAGNFHHFERLKERVRHSLISLRGGDYYVEALITVKGEAVLMDHGIVYADVQFKKLLKDNPRPENTYSKIPLSWLHEFMTPSEKTFYAHRDLFVDCSTQGSEARFLGRPSNDREANLKAGVILYLKGYQEEPVPPPTLFYMASVEEIETGDSYIRPVADMPGFNLAPAVAAHPVADADTNADATSRSKRTRRPPALYTYAAPERKKRKSRGRN